MLQTNTVDANTLELLIKLQSDEHLINFHLAGGTSLALQLGHRKSIDLDLFSLDKFDSNNLLEHLEQNYNFKTDYFEQNTLKGSINSIKIDLICHKYALVRPIIKFENIRLYSIEDIAAMKLNAIAGNGTRSKDFIDLYFILKTFNLNQTLDFYARKYENRNLMHIIKSIVYFEDINIHDWPELILEKNLSLDDVKASITNHMTNFSKKL